jgi:hypothetical protein
MTATRNGASSDPSTSQERQASAGDPPDFPQTPRISETWNQSRLRSVRFARATASRIAGRHPRTRCPVGCQKWVLRGQRRCDSRAMVRRRVLSSCWRC